VRRGKPRVIEIKELINVRMSENDGQRQRWVVQDISIKHSRNENAF
jgi:hypothetical protein